MVDAHVRTGAGAGVDGSARWEDGGISTSVETAAQPLWVSRAIFFLRLILGIQRASKRKPKLANFRGIFGSLSSSGRYVLNNGLDIHARGRAHADHIEPTRLQARPIADKQPRAPPCSSKGGLEVGPRGPIRV
jgi:hypothetical protein